MILALVVVERSLRIVMGRICSPDLMKIVKGVSAEAPFVFYIKKDFASWFKRDYAARSRAGLRRGRKKARILWGLRTQIWIWVFSFIAEPGKAEAPSRKAFRTVSKLGVRMNPNCCFSFS